MSTKTQRSYAEMFKEEAVRLVRESGQPVTHHPIPTPVPRDCEYA